MNPLIIPINVEAFLSNGATSDHKMVPVVSPDYKAVSFTSFLGSKNTPDSFKRAPSLGAGAHIHFILPDALTHCGEKGYPAVPDRFILTRLYSDSSKNKIHTKCFIIESNFMSMDGAYANSITIPRFNEKNPRTNWRYLGRSYCVDAIPAKSGTEEYLEKLTAVGAGDPLFAAYYPSCASVFGFHDTLEGVPLNSSISYFVAGFYSDSTNDPFSNVKTSEDFQKILAAMQLSVDEKAPVCSRCVLFGEVSEIIWKGTGAGYSSAASGEINVAMGNTSAEALSAAIVRSAGIKPDMERFLTALQYDLADSENLSDGNYKIDDEIYLRQFQRLDGGEIKYELAIPRKEENEQELPPFGQDFSAFCSANDALYRRTQKLEYQRAKLFYTWEQYMLCYEDPRFTPKNIPSKTDMLKEINKICADIAQSEAEITKQNRVVQKQQTEVAAKIKNRAELVETAPEPFYLPRDPVLLLSGAGVKRTYAFGEDGRFTQDGTLHCQTDVVQTNVTRADTLRYLDSAEFFNALPEWYAALLYQAVLLSPDTLPVVEKNIAKVAFSGQLPSKVAHNKYHNDSITLFMAWEAEYRPAGTGSSPATLDGWRFDSDNISYHYKGGVTPPQTIKFLFSGRTVLTPHAVIGLSNALEKWIENHQEAPEIAALAKKVKDLAVISQNLDGFTKAFSSLKQTYQFPIIGAGKDEDTAALVAANVSPHRISIIPEGTVHPLRGGYLGISRLSLVGTFGQVQNFTDSSYFGKKEICFAESMERFDTSYALIPPAFTSPVRLNLDFVSAADNTIVSSAAPETSPVCGIILPELLNRRLMVYQADGRHLGSVNTAYRGGEKYARWVDASIPERKFEESSIKDQHLWGFINSLLTVEHALADILALIDNYYARKLIPGANSFIWGRPFVLARTRMCFEFLGGSEFTKELTGFGKYNTLKAEEISFPLAFGGLQRVTDGVLGCFRDTFGYNCINPAFGTDINSSGKYILPWDKFKIAAADGKQMFTLLMEPHAAAIVQTGLLPVKAVWLNASHTTAADNLFMAAEMNPVIGNENEVQLPLDGYSWKYRGVDTYIKSEITPLLASFCETVIMDGFIVKEDKDA